MPLVKVSNSLWDSSNNLAVRFIKDLINVNTEGVATVQHHTVVEDGGGGMFFYDATRSRLEHDNGLIIDATGTGEGNGCWIRQYDVTNYSLAFFGLSVNNIANLQEKYGVEGAVVYISNEVDGGWFTFYKDKVDSSDGDSIINGWVRSSSSTLKSGSIPQIVPTQIADGVQVEFVSPAVGVSPVEAFFVTVNGKTLTPLDDYTIGVEGQVIIANVNLVPEGAEVDIKYFYTTSVFSEGVIPILVPRLIGDGITTKFATGILVPTKPECFIIHINSSNSLRPLTDFSSDVYGNIIFMVAPEKDAIIDILYYEPVLIDLAISTIPILVEGTNTPRTIPIRFGEDINVLDFGAITSDTADSTQAFKDAISFGKGRSVYCPSGTYKITENLEGLAHGVDVVIVGEGSINFVDLRDTARQVNVLDSRILLLENNYTSLVGMHAHYPPNMGKAPSLNWVRKDGTLLARAAYPVLWEWVVNSQAPISDAEWLTLESAPNNGIVSKYSTGDGDTSFRVPTVGLGGIFYSMPSVSGPQYSIGDAAIYSNEGSGIVNIGYSSIWIFTGGSVEITDIPTADWLTQQGVNIAAIQQIKIDIDVLEKEIEITQEELANDYIRNDIVSTEVVKIDNADWFTKQGINTCFTVDPTSIGIPDGVKAPTIMTKLGASTNSESNWLCTSTSLGKRNIFIGVAAKDKTPDWGKLILASNTSPENKFKGNQNLQIVGRDGILVPDKIPRSYSGEQEVAAGWEVKTNSILTNCTRVDGILKATDGVLLRKIAIVSPQLEGQIGGVIDFNGDFTILGVKTLNSGGFIIVEVDMAQHPQGIKWIQLAGADGVSPELTNDEAERAYRGGYIVITGRGSMTVTGGFINSGGGYAHVYEDGYVTQFVTTADWFTGTPDRRHISWKYPIQMKNEPDFINTSIVAYGGLDKGIDIFLNANSTSESGSSFFLNANSLGMRDDLRVTFRLSVSGWVDPDKYASLQKKTPSEQ